ncbi:MerR family transcriptional regulator [Streptomyces purpureus]|uniref:MerR family transcriptional regulator n=1 Tax=Streptomyces purpureus TaxID=1951 RepID=UPI00036D9DBD|nr:MerR family transcriptional regulator [Streptomyces purpureus]
MLIGELARATGTTARALRHYEQAGLITSARADNGYRVYDAGAVVRVRNIRYLLEAGLTLEDVTAFRVCLDGDMTVAPPSAVGLAIARRRLAVLDARIAAQTEARDRLAAALNAAGAPVELAALAEPTNPAQPVRSAS